MNDDLRESAGRRDEKLELLKIILNEIEMQRRHEPAVLKERGMLNICRHCGKRIHLKLRGLGVTEWLHYVAPTDGHKAEPIFAGERGK